MDKMPSLVAEFCQTYEVEPATPETLAFHVERCKTFFVEEFKEVSDASAMYMGVMLDGSKTIRRAALAHLIKELGDLAYVCYYTGPVLGLKIAPVEWSAEPGEVHACYLKALNALDCITEFGLDAEEVRHAAEYHIGRLVYLTTRAAWAHDVEPHVFAMACDLVHKANMDKRWDDGEIHRREDGKILKPPTWEEPDLAPLIAEYVF